MRRIVLDASALMTFFENRAGATRIESLLVRASEGKESLLMSVVNLGEVYYSLWRTRSEGVARELLGRVLQMPVEIVPADLELTCAAAALRARHRLAYVDCFAAALAEQRKAYLATSDPDFRALGARVRLLFL